MKRTIAAAAGAILLSTFALPAQAGTTTPTDDATVAELRSELSKFGVDPATSDSLVAKFEAGEVWDSFGSAEPVGTRDAAIDGFSYTIDTYADGSFRASGVEAPTRQTPTPAFTTSGAVSPMATITGCSTSSSAGTTYFSNCRVSESVGIATGEFRADYQMSIANDTATITYAGGPGAVIVGGTTNQATVTTVRPTYAPSTPAIAELRFTAGAVGDWGGASLWVQLRVTPGAAVAQSNFDVVPD